MCADDVWHDALSVECHLQHGLLHLPQGSVMLPAVLGPSLPQVAVVAE